MPFIIMNELPPEANPLNQQTLYQTLTRAASTDPQQIQTGTQQLQNWETISGYYSSLQAIFIDASLPLEVRYLSAIQLKNGIDKYWRKTAANAISKDEKTVIRSCCVQSGIDEANHRLALQNALVVAKITRFEFPHDWPDAISSVVAHLRAASPNTIRSPRTLLILLYIVKELATGRLQRTRASLQSAAPEAFDVLSRLYVDRACKWMTLFKTGGDDEGGALDAIEQSLLALRVIRRLTIAGYKNPNRDKQLGGFWRTLNNQFGEILSIVQHHPQLLNGEVLRLLEKHLVQVSKLHLDMVRIHPAAFALLPDSTSLARAYWGLLVDFGVTFGSQSTITTTRIGTDGDSDSEEMPCMEKLSLKGLLLLRGCAKMIYNRAQTFNYQHQEDKEEKKQSVELMKSQLFTEDHCREIMETLVTRFFVFRPRDLREWEAEPEEWERREEGEGDLWEFSIRSCAEKLFLDLVINNKDLLIQPLLNVFYTVATPQNTDVLLKDSIYAAIGLAAPVLEGQLDFDAFLNSTLVPEVQLQQPGYNILRRRIAIILGQWLTCKEGLNRSVVYEIFQHLLNKDEEKFNDQVVRVTAGRQLKNIVDPFEFTPEPFMPYAPTLLGRLMALIEEVELNDTKMALLNTISVIVVKMQNHITPFTDQIISLLPPLWSQAGDEHLMKQSILNLLTALITSMESESIRYHTAILPLIQSSIEPELESPTRPYLLEDALELWAAILIQAPEASAELINLIHYLFPIFDTADTLRKGLSITESYILLAPQAMLEISDQFLASFASLLGSNLRREATGTINHLAQRLIQAAESLGGPPAVENITNVLCNTGYLEKLMDGLRNAYNAHQTTGPNRVHSGIDGIVETDYFSVLARIALAGGSQVFISAMTNIAHTRKEQFEDTMHWLLPEWFSHLENIGDPSSKKLMCLALTVLLSTPMKWILSHLQDLMTLWTDTIAELVVSKEDGGDGKDSMVYWNPESLKREGEALEDERRRNVLFSDPIHRIDVKDCVRQCLEAVIGACGGQAAFQRDWLVNVDEDVVKNFSSLRIS